MVPTGVGIKLKSTVGTSPFILLVQYDFIALERDFTCSSHPKAYTKKRRDKSQPRKNILSLDFEKNSNLTQRPWSQKHCLQTKLKIVKRTSVKNTPCLQQEFIFPYLFSLIPIYGSIKENI